ncbi:MAG: putative nucleotide-binding protein (sugar kinase/HSP70/actin superfamily) [Gammaproteobacteria bacterium]|jgi:predicted nucleotide-binding protein (sugar kinase/HSP70/actin superfamily)
MNEDTFNMQLRKFLKKVGITSQREMEQAVRDALESGALRGDESLQASVVLKVAEIELEVTITGDISLE